MSESTIAIKRQQYQRAMSEELGQKYGRSMRKPPLDEGRRWLRQAQEDLHWTRHLAGGIPANVYS